MSGGSHRRVEPRKASSSGAEALGGILDGTLARFVPFNVPTALDDGGALDDPLADGAGHNAVAVACRAAEFAHVGVRGLDSKILNAGKLRVGRGRVDNEAFGNGKVSLVILMGHLNLEPLVDVEEVHIYVSECLIVLLQRLDQDGMEPQVARPDPLWGVPRKMMPKVETKIEREASWCLSLRSLE
ncbi:hypothetical protein HYQ46_004605 [Verticillium longisporum]|nr:hypothetical protein HYQ46_004605 [Verticillium longisporum]